MPCTKCKDGKYKWGETGECKYDSKEACEKANPKHYNKMRPTPLGKKSYEEYEKELKEFKNTEEFKLSKAYKVKLSKIDDIEDAVSRGLGLVDFVEEALDEAFTQFIKAKDIVRFDMNDAYTEGEGLLDEFLADIKELGIDVPADVKQLQKGLNDLDDAIKDAERKINDF
tara:strand:- start:29 stop:538 length:510 start_codon:yes stop_codon:yes gene_type:complete